MALPVAVRVPFTRVPSGCLRVIGARCEKARIGYCHGTGVREGSAVGDRTGVVDRAGVVNCAGIEEYARGIEGKTTGVVNRSGIGEVRARSVAERAAIGVQSIAHMRQQF